MRPSLNSQSSRHKIPSSGSSCRNCSKRPPAPHACKPHPALARSALIAVLRATSAVTLLKLPQERPRNSLARATLALMKTLRSAPAFLILLLMRTLAAAQTGDWHVVENLPRRSLISVEDMHRVIHNTCRFQGVVDGQLFCEYGVHLFGPSEIAFRQASIRAVRREHNSTLIGLTVGAGAGAAIGAASDATPAIGRGGSALLGALLYGGLGALVGSAHGHFCHGKVIYHNPNDPSRTTGSSSGHDRGSADGINPADRITAARSQYMQPEDVSPGVNDVTLAQLSGRRRGPIFLPSGGYPRSAYAGMWMPSPSARHAAIGFLIGFGLGAAHPNDGTVRGHVALGLLVGLVGAGIGAAIPSFHARNPHWRGPWPDEADEEEGDQYASRSEPLKSGPTKATPVPQIHPPTPAQPQQMSALDDPPLSAEAP